jgi:Tfp pilus assembly protein PilF
MRSPKPCAEALAGQSRRGSAFRRTSCGANALLAALVLTLAGCVTSPTTSETPGAPGEAAQVAFAAAVKDLRAQEYAAAAARLEALTRDFPRLATPWANLGIAYAGQGREAEAEQAWQQALTLAPGEPVAANRLALRHREAGRFQEARALYEAALAAQPEHAASHLNLGILCDLYLQDQRCALAGYERYLELAGEDAKVSGWVVELKRRMAPTEGGS